MTKVAVAVGQAMWASSHIDAERLARLRTSLLRQLDEYADRANDSHATADALMGQRDVDSLLERELVETSAKRFDAVVHEARAALHRIDVGAYGLCEACQAPIPYERLEALPHAGRCVDCPDPAARSRL